VRRLVVGWAGLDCGSRLRERCPIGWDRTVEVTSIWYLRYREMRLIGWDRTVDQGRERGVL
jgi:hypothetical protein